MSEMNSEQINRAIAELRGWTDIAERETPMGELLLCGNPPDLDSVGWYALPDYLLWQHAGKLLEEMCRPTLSQHNNDDQWSVLYWKDIGDGGAVVQSGPSCDEPPDAIRRAWKQWKEGAKC